MPKSSKQKMYADDEKVITELQKNSKQSIDALAKKCGFSRQKVWRTVKRLEEDKTIWGYCAIVDEESQNLKHYTLLIKRTPIPLDKNTSEYISTGNLNDILPEGNIKIENCLYVHGEYDWIMSFSAPDIKMMKKFCEKIINVFGKYIDEFTILETMIPIRKQGIKHPDGKKLQEYL